MPCELKVCIRCMQVQNFTQSAFEKIWASGALRTKSDSTPDEEKTRNFLLIMMNYVNSNCIGVGGTPFFVATYGFIGTV